MGDRTSRVPMRQMRCVPVLDGIVDGTLSLIIFMHAWCATLEWVRSGEHRTES